MTPWGNRYYYFDTPDYEDCVKKVWIMSQAAVGISTVYCGYELVFERVAKPRERMPFTYCLGRLARFNGAPLATAVAGATSACVMSRMRGNVDDCWNYFLGFGIPAGVIWTGFFRTVNNGHLHSFKGAALGFAFASAAAIMKKAHMDDWILWPEKTILGNIKTSGPFGGDHWDFRTPGFLFWEDPGRRPQS